MFFRFIPNYSCLAISELDEKHISVFSFRTREGVLTNLQHKHSLEKVRLSLLTQICQKHVLRGIVQQLHMCYNLIRKEEKQKHAVSESTAQKGNSEMKPMSLLGIFFFFYSNCLTKHMGVKLRHIYVIYK